MFPDILFEGGGVHGPGMSPARGVQFNSGMAMEVGPSGWMLSGGCLTGCSSSLTGRPAGTMPGTRRTPNGGLQVPGKGVVCDGPDEVGTELVFLKI